MSPANESENKEISPIQVIKRAVGTASFTHTDVGGLVFSLLDSLDSDMIALGVEEYSETTESISQELVNTLAGELDEYRTDLEEEEEEEESEELKDVMYAEEEEEDSDDEDDEDEEENVEDNEDEDLYSIVDNEDDDENDPADEDDDEEESAILQSFDHLEDEGDNNGQQETSARDAK